MRIENEGCLVLLIGAGPRFSCQIDNICLQGRRVSVPGITADEQPRTSMVVPRVVPRYVEQ